MGRASHERHDPSLIALRPSGDRLHLYFDRTVLSTGLDGWIRDGEHGLFVHEARTISEYRVFVGKHEPRPVGVSALTARRSHGYHVCKVLEKNGTLHVVRPASPWSLTERLRHRVRDLVMRS